MRPTEFPSARSSWTPSTANFAGATLFAYEIMITPVGQKFIVIDTGSLTFSSGQVRTFVGLNSQTGGFTYTMLQDVN
jgi:hypothetical protein